MISQEAIQCDNTVAKSNDGPVWPREGIEGIRAFKTFEFIKIQEETSKNVLVSGKKEKQYVIQIIYYNQKILPTKVPFNVDIADKPVVHCHIPVVKKNLQRMGNK